ncbi:MAG: hypothetical protein N2235_07990 [Fischerella sp.]|nr:hypothetical protein [Fischerella sp.]
MNRNRRAQAATYPTEATVASMCLPTGLTPSTPAEEEKRVI